MKDPCQLPSDIAGRLAIKKVGQLTSTIRPLLSPGYHHNRYPCIFSLQTAQKGACKLKPFTTTASATVKLNEVVFV